MSNQEDVAEILRQHEDRLDRLGGVVLDLVEVVRCYSGAFAALMCEPSIDKKVFLEKFEELSAAILDGQEPKEGFLGNYQVIRKAALMQLPEADRPRNG